MSHGGPSDPDPVDPGPTPEPELVRSDSFVDQEWRTSSADVAVDANGGTYVAGYYYQPYASGPTSAFYRYCAAGCDNPDHWQEVQLLDGVNEVQEEVNAAGKPRMLIRTSRDQWDGDEHRAGERLAGAAGPHL